MILLKKKKKVQSMRFVLNMENLDTTGRFVFESFNELSLKDYPMEHIRFLYRGNLNKKIDKGILKKEREEGRNNVRLCSGRNVKALTALERGAKTLRLVHCPGTLPVLGACSLEKKTPVW